MSDVRELTEPENLCLEAVQERRIVYASDVVDYVWQEYGQDWKKEKATRYLSRLARWGIIKRESRVSAGWGQGWHPSAYSIIDHKGATHA